jgi:hypothetical protein
MAKQTKQNEHTHFSNFMMGKKTKLMKTKLAESCFHNDLKFSDGKKTKQNEHTHFSDFPMGKKTKIMKIKFAESCLEDTSPKDSQT